MIPHSTPIWLALLLAGGVVSVIVALRYFLISGAFAWLTSRLRPALYAGLGRQIAMEIRYSLIAAVIYGAPVGMVLWAWRRHDATAIYSDWGEYPFLYLPLSLLAYLIVQDSWFYWSHRAMHHWPALFRLAHGVHHKSRPPTAWTAMSFHPLETLSGALLVPLLVFVVPIHFAMLGLVLTIATLFGVTNHLGWEIFPRRFVHSRSGNWLISASHHEKHHEDYQCNFGLYFRFWDHLCHTDRGLSNRLAAEMADR